MKQQHSFHRLFFHIVFSTKNREHLFGSPEDGRVMLDLFKVKAHALDAYIEEFGFWRDHVHMLVRTSPSRSLADLYGQMKGFAARAWNVRYPNRAYYWQDGVFSITVDPDRCEDLRSYIRDQWEHHELKTLVDRWELPDPGPEGLPGG
jgi:putative transposase